MKKLIFNILILSNIVFANSDMQVFISSNSKEFDSNKLEKLYSGTIAGFQVESKEIFKNLNLNNTNEKTSILTQGAVAGSVSAGAAAAANGGLKGLDSNGGLVGLAVIGAITTGLYLFNASNKVSNDKFYIYVGKTLDKNNLETLVYGFIVSEDIQTPTWVEQIVLKKIKG